MAQAQSVADDCARSELQVARIAATRRLQIGSFFAGARRGISDFLARAVASVQAFVAQKQAEIIAAVARTLAWIRSAVTGAVRAAQALAGRIRERISQVITSLTTSVQSKVEGVTGRITGLIDSIPLPDIPGIGRIRGAAVGLLNDAGGLVSGAVGKLGGFVNAAFNAGMNVLDSALSIVSRALDAALTLASDAILFVMRTISRLLNSVVTFIANTLRTALLAIIIPILNAIEAALAGLLGVAERRAVALLRRNRDEYLSALAEAVVPVAPRRGAQAASADSQILVLQQLGRDAAHNGRVIVQTFELITGGVITSLVRLLTTAAARIVAGIAGALAQLGRAVMAAVSQALQILSKVAGAVGDFLRELSKSFTGWLDTLVDGIRSFALSAGSQLLLYAENALRRVGGFVKTFVRSLISGRGLSGSVRDAIGAYRQTQAFLAPALAPVLAPILAPVLTPAFAGGPILIIGGLVIIIIGGVAYTISLWLAIVIVVLLVLLIALLLWLLWRWLTKPKPKPTKRVISVNPSALELGVGGRDINSAATIAPGVPPVPPLVWTINPGGTAPAGVSIIGGGAITVLVRAGHPPHGTVVGGSPIRVRAALASNPADFADSNPVMMVQVVSASYAAAPPLANVPSLIPGTPPPNTAEPNRDGITGNTATVNATTAPAARPVAVTIRTPLAGTTVAGATVTPGVTTGDVGLRIADTATDAHLDETRPATSGPAARMADLTVNAVSTDVSSLAFQGRDPLGPYSARNRINYTVSDTLHPPLTRIVGELITGVLDDFNIQQPNGGFNPTFRLNLAVPANSWVDRLIMGAGIRNVADGRPAVDVNRFVGPGVPQLPRSLIYSQRFQYSSWRGAGTVTSNTFADGQHIKRLTGTPPASFQVGIEHHFVGVAPSIPPTEPYAGPPLVVLSNIVVTPDAPGATALAADGVSTAQLAVTSTVAGRSVTWSVLSGDIAVTAGNPATPPATATLRAGVTTGTFGIRAADTIYPNRQFDGTVGVVAVTLRNMRATPNPVPAGTDSATVSLDANPGGRTVNWSVDPASAAAGVTVTPATTGPGAPAMSATVTRPAGFTGSVVVTAADSVLAAQTRRVRIIFQ